MAEAKLYGDCGSYNMALVFKRLKDWLPKQWVDESDISTKQDTLVSGTNIKTINGNSILGIGDVAVEVGGNDKIKIQQTIIFTYNL